MRPSTIRTDYQVTLLATVLVAVGPLTMSMYTPSMPSLTAILGTSSSMVQLTLTLYLAAFAAAQLIYGPVADRFGRRPVLIGGMLVFAVGSAFAAMSESIGQLLVARFVQALGACAAPVVARALIRDLYDGRQAARMLSLVALAMTVAPAIGPLIGGYLSVHFGWASVFVVLMALGLTNTVIGLTVLPETLKPEHRTELAFRPVLARYGQLLSAREFVGYVAALSCALGGLLAYAAIGPFIFIDMIGLSPDLYGWTLVATTAAYFVGSLLANRFVGRVGIDRLILAGGGLILSGGLGLSVAVFTDTILIVTILGPMTLWLVGMGLVLPNAMAGAIGPYPHMAGQASSLIGFLQMGAGALGSGAISLFGGETALAAGVVPILMAVAGIGTYALLVGRYGTDGAGAARQPDDHPLTGTEQG